MGSKMGSTSRHFESNAELSLQLCAAIAQNLEDAIAARGVATLAVSGGSTPRPLFEALAHTALDWSRVCITLVDERWVDEQHEDSNAQLVRTHLLQHRAGAATFIGMKTGAELPQDAEAAVAKNLSAFSPTIDVVVLGMGEDGHTASFFPGASALPAALDRANTQLCIAVTPPAAAHARMSLTLASLLRARHLYLHICGESKWAVLQQAIEAGESEELPVSHLLHGAAPSLQIYYSSGS